jgi:hypothetical protein
MNTNWSKTFLPRKYALALSCALAAIAIVIAAAFPRPALSQDQDQDDPPSRVARLGYMEGSVSFQPAGESEWVQAVSNRPITTGDKLWADQNSRAEVQLGSATIDLAANTGFSFLNLDDRTVQIELSSGTINLRVRELDRDDVFEIDTANQAFTVSEPGRYRVEASENGDYTVVTIRDGSGESTGNGQSYTLHAGQRTTFSGTSSLNAEVQQIGGSDDFDNWSEARYRRYDDSPSARYCSHDMVGIDDLDNTGDWQPSSDYGHVWFPRVAVDWAPYHEGHWAWIDPWGWTWVDDEAWGYAPFHYGRWLTVGGRWGWIPGPVNVRPVYAPALVVFVGGGGAAIGGNVAWFPLGPREVYVPSYRVSPAYVNRVNVTNTTVNTTTITNVYNTTIVNKTTNITNVTYVNRNVRGAMTAVPQRAFVSAQPVGQTAVRVDARQFASAPVSARAAVPPVREAVLGVHANTANHVAAPPQAVASRQVIAKAAPPPPAAPFAARQQMLAQHPGQPLNRQEMEKLRPASATAPTFVKRAPPAKPATATSAPANQPVNRPGNAPAANERPGANPAPARPQPGNHPAANQPAANQPPPNRPAPNNRPDNRPGNANPENGQPAPNAAQPNRPQPNQPTEPPARSDRPPSAQPNNRPAPNRPQPNQPANDRPENGRPENNRPENNRPDTARPENSRPTPDRPQPNRPAEPPPRTNNNENDRPPAAQPNNRAQPNRVEPNRPQPNQAAPRQQNPPPSDRPQQRPPAAEPKPAPQQQPKPRSPQDKKREDEQRKQDQKKPPQ